MKESMTESTKKAAGAGSGFLGGAGIADIAEGNGLDRAAAAAGEVLDGIFGLLPWEESGEAVSEAAGQTAILLIESGVVA